MKQTNQIELKLQTLEAWGVAQWENAKHCMSTGTKLNLQH